jgi:hypothetical protein
MCVIRKWHLARFENKEVKAEVCGFSESIQGKIERGMKGHSLVCKVSGVGGICE